MSSTMSATGFRAGSIESIKALQLEHRYERHAAAALQAASIPAAGLGRRNLAHDVEAHIEQRSNAQLHRKLGGRRSAAAVKWLLNRQEERERFEQIRTRAPGYGFMHRTSPDNPLCIHTHYDEPSISPEPRPCDKTSALTQLQLDATMPADGTSMSAAATQTSLPMPLTSQSSHSTSLSPTASSTPNCTATAESVAGTELAPPAAAHIDEGEDAVAVIADGAADILAPPHLTSHLGTSSLFPKANPAVAHGSVPSAALSAMHAAAQEAYWKQQELEDLVSLLLTEYPHGIPRKMIMDLRQLGITDIPSLGFGCPTSSSVHDAAMAIKE